MASKKFSPSKGFYGIPSDDEAFLKPDAGPWKSDFSGASESGTYQSARWDDNSGFIRGSNHDDTESHGLRNKMPDEYGDTAHERLASLIDDQKDMPSGPMLPGGGKVSDNAPDHGGGWEGSGRKGPRYPVKPLAPRTNARD